MSSMLTVEGAVNFKLTSQADMMLDNLTVEFSPDGSNKKMPEINIHKYICDYIQEIETRQSKDHGTFTFLNLLWVRTRCTGLIKLNGL